MASRKTSFFSKPSSIFPTSSISDDPIGPDGLFEFDEADLWSSASSNPASEPKKSTIPSYREARKMGRKTMIMSMAEKSGAKATSASVPVNIPDWPKILQEGYKEQGRRESEEESDGDFDGGNDDGGDGRVPPHEYLARTRGASFSVHEGVGRTLKGRDLRRVRNAIWKKVGFED